MILFSFAFGCGEPLPAELEDVPTASEQPHHDHAQHQPMASAAPVLGASIYQLDVELTDEGGEPFPWNNVRGHPTFVGMIYTQCTSACPMIISALQNVDDSLPAEVRDEARYLLISFDPERDTAEALSRTKRDHDLGDRWTLVRAESGDVREISAVLGIRYRKLVSADFNHSSVFTLLNQEGEIAARVDGLGKEITPLVEGAVALMQ